MPVPSSIRGTCLETMMTMHAKGCVGGEGETIRVTVGTGPLRSSGACFERLPVGLRTGTGRASQRAYFRVLALIP
jgi:hypothetical protein